MTTIDCTPTWQGILPLLVEVAANGTTSEARKEAWTELYRLAKMADDRIERDKQIVRLDSVGSILRLSDRMVFPALADLTGDPYDDSDDGTPLAECSSEWMVNLSADDFKTIMNLLR